MVRPLWRMLKTDPLSGAMNMALDEVLLQSVQAGTSPPVVRLYRWQPEAVTLGYAQRGSRQVNADYCKSAGIDIVRRLTGGRAVLHAQEVTYAVISRQTGLFATDIQESYRIIAKVLLHCLGQFGLDVELSGRHAGSLNSAAVEQSACFTAPAQFEILCAGKKICGSSQKREQQSFLQHGSLPLEMDLYRLFWALNTDKTASAAQAVARLAAKVGWLKRFCRQPCTLDELERQLMSSFALLWPVNFSVGTPSAQELAQAQQLAEQRYRIADWHLSERT